MARNPAPTGSTIVDPPGQTWFAISSQAAPRRGTSSTDDAPAPAMLGARWWLSPEYAQLEREVEDAFAGFAGPLSGAPLAGEPLTGELVRPYARAVDLRPDGDTSAGADGVIWAGVGPVPPPTPVFGVPTTGTDAPGRGRGSAPSEAMTAAQRATTRATELPSRRELRARREAAQRASSRTVATRRLAKGTVLAMTIFGVVASNAPKSLHQSLFGPEAGSLADADLAGAPAGALVGALALSADGRSASLTPRGDAVEAAVRERLVKRQQVQSVSEAGQQAGSVIAAAAKAQGAADAAAARAAYERASREAQRNPQALARMMVADRGWSSEQFTCLNLLWTKESNWRWNATNPSSGAYGIPQSLPGSKMATAGADWRTNPATQIEWGLDYIAGRYGNPCGAWAHSKATNWY